MKLVLVAGLFYKILGLLHIVLMFHNRMYVIPQTAGPELYQRITEE